MVCVACLLPLFLIPVVNALPLLFHFIISKIYGLLGWEYRKPARTAPACPFRLAAGKNNEGAAMEIQNPHSAAGDPIKTSPLPEDSKQD